MHGRIDPQLIKSWIDAGAPMIKNYKEIGSGAVQLAQAYRFLRAIFNVAIDDGIMKENPCRIKGAGTPRHAERHLEACLSLRDEHGTPVPGYGWMFPAGDGTVNIGVVFVLFV
jgi:hypothetical protein